jgi:hypothetical protein
MEQSRGDSKALECGSRLSPQPAGWSFPAALGSPCHLSGFLLNSSFPATIIEKKAEK